MAETEPETMRAIRETLESFAGQPMFLAGSYVFLRTGGVEIAYTGDCAGSPPEHPGSKMNLKRDIEKATQCLVGLSVCHLGYAGNMRGIHFGNARKVAGVFVGDYALHLQCPWRLEGGGRILTGFQDYYTPASDQPEEGWLPESGTGNLQEEVLAQVFDLPKFGAGPLVRARHNPKVVVRTLGDSLGGLVLLFTGRLRLRVFPAASVEEHWRIFQPKRRVRHFVVDGRTAYYE